LEVFNLFFSQTKIIFGINRKLQEQQEKLCNTAIGRELPECYHPEDNPSLDTTHVVESSTSIALGKYKISNQRLSLFECQVKLFMTDVIDPGWE